jgi:hypothetical protein
MGRLPRRVYQAIDVARELFIVMWLRIPQPRRIERKKTEIPVIASLTSHPGRIQHVWLSIETLLRQTVKPQALVLILSLEEFPGRKIPTKLSAQARRGLIIKWVDQNHGSFDKLLPIRTLYPDSAIATFDDDKYFPKDILYRLHQASTLHPTAVIGARGWRIKPSVTDNRVHYGDGWDRITGPATGRDLLMPGGNGCMYPHDSLDPEVDNWSAALKICPTADDIWFWGSLTKAESPSHCLGLPAHRPVKRQQESAALSGINRSRNDQQFTAAIKHFRLEDFIDNFHLSQSTEVKEGNERE